MNDKKKLIRAIRRRKANWISDRLRKECVTEIKNRRKDERKRKKLRSVSYTHLDVYKRQELPHRSGVPYYRGP